MGKKKSTKLFDSTFDNVKKPITRSISKYYIISIAVVTIFFTVGTYFFTLSSTRVNVRNQLMSFINERGLRESALFLESDAYQARFQEEYIERYKRINDSELNKWFNEHLEKRIEDGTYRSKPELYYGKDMPLGRRDVSASMMIGAKTEITPELIKALAIGYDMVNQYGPAWRKPFDDLYFSSPEKTSVSRWPGTPWGLMMDDSVEWRDEEWMAITMKELNPLREQRWSGVLYDERNGNWMVSGVTPLDIDGIQVGMVGTDLLLNDIVLRTNETGLHGTYNILLQADGRVIAHPKLAEEIIAHKGMLNAQTYGDEYLQHIFEHVKTITSFPQVIDHVTEEAFIAVTQIEGPDWYFITIYPHSLFVSKARRTASLVFLYGVILLILIHITNWIIIKRIIVNPITLMTKIVKNYKVQLKQGAKPSVEFHELNPELLTRRNEIGLLYNNFNNMLEQIKTREIERDEALKTLSSSEKLLNKIAENYPNSYLSVINSDMTVGFTAGQEFQKQNLNPRDFEGMKLEQIFDKQWEDIKEYFTETFKGTEQTFELHINDQKQLYNTIPLKNEDGLILQILSVAENITTRRLAEEELLKHRDQLEELIKERTSELEGKNTELERFNKLLIGREFRIKELRDQVEELEDKLKAALNN
jgi:hypothetical protein